MDIPACPGMKTPGAIRVGSYETVVRYDLVWVRLDSSYDTWIPECPGFEDKNIRAVMGEPDVWKTSSARLVENFTDCSSSDYLRQLAA